MATPQEVRDGMTHHHGGFTRPEHTPPEPSPTPENHPFEAVVRNSLHRLERLATKKSDARDLVDDAANLLAWWGENKLILQRPVYSGLQDRFAAAYALRSFGPLFEGSITPEQKLRITQAMTTHHEALQRLAARFLEKYDTPERQKAEPNTASPSTTESSSRTGTISERERLAQNAQAMVGEVKGVVEQLNLLQEQLAQAAEAARAAKAAKAAQTTR